MRVPFYDPRADYYVQKDAIDRAMAEVLESGHYALGPHVEAFEREFAAYCGVGYAIGVSSGTAALEMALVACGVGAGDEVITVPNSDISTAAAITHCGARVVFVDVERDSLVMDPSLVASKVTPNTKALLPVHLFGQPVPMDEIQQIAAAKNLLVIEDAALAIGGRYRGRQPGAIGDVGCFSMNSRKILSAFGDAGAVTTDQPDLAEAIRSLRDYGKDRSRPRSGDDRPLVGQSNFKRIGFNARLDEIQASVLRVKLSCLDDLEGPLANRRSIASRYDEGFRGLPFAIPRTSSDCQHAYRAYTILVERSETRNALIEFLQQREIETAVYYAPPLHLQPAYANLGHSVGDFPVAEEIGERMLSLPIHPTMSDTMVDWVIESVRTFVGRSP